MPDTPAALLDNLVSQLGSPYGAEHSIKIIPSTIRDRRLLLSIHKNTLGENPENKLLSMLGELGFPQQFTGEITSRLELADIVHFGYEDYGQGYLFKCYLEFAEKIRQVLEQNKAEKALVHYAIKWDPQHLSRFKISQYCLQPTADINAVKQFLATVYCENKTSVAYKMMLEVLKLDKVSAVQDEMMLLSVNEEDNQRYSFDLNLYGMGLHLADVSSQLMEIIDYFNVDTEEWDKLYHSASSQELGHLAGGLDGNGREFFTVYFGVEERGMN